MPSILITGGNRGLGLEWARQYAMAEWRVYATCRHPAEAAELNELAGHYPHLSVHRLDVTRQDEIQALAADLGNASLDILLNNAGVYLEKFDDSIAGGLSYDDWLYTLLVNTLGPVRVTEAFIPHVARGQRRLVIAVTSHMGSIAEISSPGSYYYRSSKAALNAAMKGLSLELRAQGIGVLILHPGWVQTRMGGPGAQITTTQSVTGMRAIAERFSPADSGRFFRYNGTEIPW
jgi:NAD(P)-dependent dehydrogenase (short-subunit alcohol dehydrogenase family)